MEHITITVIDDKLRKLTPDEGYVVYDMVSQKTFSEVITDVKSIGNYYAVEKGATPVPPTPVPPTPEDELARARQRKVAQIDAYDKSEHVNVFYLNDVPMWLTVSERQQLATQISANEAVGRASMAKWFGGNEFTFPLATWKQMLVALEVYAGDALNVTEAHKAAVNAMDSVAGVNAYDITQGYPEVLMF